MLKTIIKAGVLAACLLQVSVNVYAINHGVYNQVRLWSQDLMTKNNVQGMSIALIEGDHTQYENFGYTDTTYKHPVTQDTAFDIASLTKTFTAQLVAMQAVQHRWDIQQPVAGFSPSLKKSQAFLTISFADLLCHVSGLPFNFHAAITSNADFIITSSKWAFPTAPQTQYQYSNVGITLAGLLVARANHALFETLLTQDILKPLGLSHTVYKIPLGAKRTWSLAQGYDEQGRPHAPYQAGVYAPAGGLKSTTRDLVTYLRAHMQPDPHFAPAMALVHKDYYCMQDKKTCLQLGWQSHALAELSAADEQPETERQTPTLDPTLPPTIDPTLAPQPVFAVTSTNQPDWSVHQEEFIDKTGMAAGMSAYVAYAPQQHVGVVILINKTKIDDRVALGRKILEQLLEEKATPK